MDEQDQERKTYENREGFLNSKWINKRCSNCRHGTLNILGKIKCRIGKDINAGAGCNTFFENRSDLNNDAVVGEFESPPQNQNQGGNY